MNNHVHYCLQYCPFFLITIVVLLLLFHVNISFNIFRSFLHTKYGVILNILKKVTPEMSMPGGDMSDVCDL